MVTITEETLQTLLSNFYEACALLDELNIYEHEDFDRWMQEAKEWTQEKFGRTIDKKEYE